VVIPTYNRERLLGYTLQSLAGQSLDKAAFEVLVCDDGSSDGTADLVKTFAGRLNVRYFWQEDLGHRAAAARNLGIRHAEAPVTVLMDCGVLGHSRLLAEHLASHEQADGPVAVCGYVYCFNLDNEEAERINKIIIFDDPDATIDNLRRTGEFGDVRDKFFYSRYGDDFADLPAPWLNYWTCNVSARTDQLRKVGMFDEDFTRWGGEDLDVGYRLYRDGARLILNRNAAAIHCPHEKSFEQNNGMAELNYRIMAEKYGTPIIKVLLELPHINFFAINDIIRERGLPRCADYVAQREAAQQSA
jgi:glycosyltransferase involved in cell wall biosynthesis